MFAGLARRVRILPVTSLVQFSCHRVLSISMPTSAMPGHNLTLHVMSDSDMKRVAFLQELFSYPEMILKVAHTLSSHYAFAVEKLAVESVGLLLATRVDGLVYDERDALKGVTVVDAQSKPHGVVAVLGQGGNVI